MLNAASTLPEQLDALVAQSYSGAWEVVLADNGSTDGADTLGLAWADRLPALSVIDVPATRGASYARNVGAREAKGDFLLFCDADDVATSGWVEAMAEAAVHADLAGGRLDDVELNSPTVRNGGYRRSQTETSRGHTASCDSAERQCGCVDRGLSRPGGLAHRFHRWHGGHRVLMARTVAVLPVALRAQARMLYRHRSSATGLARTSNSDLG